jgi:hypothetical protein
MTNTSLLNLSLCDFINVFGQRGADSIEEFEQVFIDRETIAIRDHIDRCINILSVIYQ